MDALPQLILDQQTTAVLLVDDDLRVSYLNQAAELLLATSRARCLGEPLLSVARNGPQFEAQLRAALSAEQSFTRRHTRLSPPGGGEALIVDLTVTPMAHSGSLSLLIELQPLERMLRISREAAQSQVQQTTRELVRGLAHEIKNPLGGIRGAAQLLSRELSRSGQRDYTGIIIEEADRLRSLVDRMLGPNKLPHLVSSNVHQLLERVRSLLEAEQPGRVEFVRDYDPSIPDLMCDPEQILQALLNVCRNAMEALQHTDNARILLRTRSARQITIGNERHRLVFRIDIIDNGPGIPADLLERLFYPMISGRAEGTGLGLSIAQTIVTQHHGLIEVESHPGMTHFTLLLPLLSGPTESLHETN